MVTNRLSQIKEFLKRQVRGAWVLLNIGLKIEKYYKQISWDIVKPCYIIVTTLKTLEVQI